jgi:hypothetical protein
MSSCPDGAHEDLVPRVDRPRQVALRQLLEPVGVGVTDPFRELDEQLVPLRHLILPQVQHGNVEGGNRPAAEQLRIFGVVLEHLVREQTD